MNETMESHVSGKTSRRDRWIRFEIKPGQWDYIPPLHVERVQDCEPGPRRQTRCVATLNIPGIGLHKVTVEGMDAGTFVELCDEALDAWVLRMNPLAVGTETARLVIEAAIAESMRACRELSQKAAAVQHETVKAMVFPILNDLLKEEAALGEEPSADEKQAKSRKKAG